MKKTQPQRRYSFDQDCIPRSMQLRATELGRSRCTSALTEAEEAEYWQLLDRIDDINLGRISALSAIADMQGVKLDDLIDQVRQFIEAD